MSAGILSSLRKVYRALMPEKVRRLAWLLLLTSRSIVSSQRSRVRRPSLRDLVSSVRTATVSANSCSLYAWHYERAMKAYQALDSDLALLHLNVCIGENPDDWDKWHVRGLIYLQVVGDVDEAVRQFTMARRIREKLYAAELGKTRYRFLDAFWGYQIGHIANMEHLIKREIMMGRDPKKIVLYFPADAKPGNSALLRKMADYITVVSDEAKLPASRQALGAVMEEYYICESIDGKLKHWWHASPEIFKAWEAQGRAPLLELSAMETARGKDALRELGLPDGAWFVPLHVRDSGFKADQGYGAIENVLNGEISSYAQAIQAVVERGGWVIRIGDSRMQPLPPMRNVIDYAVSQNKSPETDLYILGAGRFYIGTSSGPAYVPPLFGIPCVLTNWAPSGQRPFNERDLYILKTYGEPQSGSSELRPMKFSEFLSPPVGYAASSERARSLEVLPNTPEEIREVVVEMLDRLDQGVVSRADADELQARFDEVANSSRCIGNAKVGADFLRRHAERL